MLSETVLKVTVPLEIEVETVTKCRVRNEIHKINILTVFNNFQNIVTLRML